MDSELNEDLFANFLVNKENYSKETFKCAFIRLSESLSLRIIEVFCSNCNLSRPFESTRNFASGGAQMEKKVDTKINKVVEYSFKCLFCSGQLKTYFLHLDYDHGDLIIQKVGEYPRKEINRQPELEKFFKADKDNYRKAENCLANGYGIAAFAYLRKIIEGNIKNLITLVKNDTNNTEKTLEALEKLHVASHMSEVISVANLALPDYLVKEGVNPLGAIYKILSEGVHNLSDEECLKRAQHVKSCILFLVKELTERKKNLDEFHKNLGSLSNFK